MTHPQFFGYGSLVNLRTHAYPRARPAEIMGWQRIWRSVAGCHQAVLSVITEEGSSLRGVIADVPNADWVALDQRESLYNRHLLPDGTAIYEVQNNLVATPAPILRSYLDVVTQGFHDLYGPPGVTDFFATTTNWRAVEDDRAAPRYPRHQRVGPEITALVDHHLAVTVKQLM